MQIERHEIRSNLLVQINCWGYANASKPTTAARRTLSLGFSYKFVLRIHVQVRRSIPI
jgi:hypothetical protein